MMVDVHFKGEDALPRAEHLSRITGTDFDFDGALGIVSVYSVPLSIVPDAYRKGDKDVEIREIDTGKYIGRKIRLDQKSGRLSCLSSIS
jgi:hypothetical protein